MIGEVTQEVWKTVAADIDGVPQPELIGKLTLRLRAMFAYRAEAEEWEAAKTAAGYECVIGSAAVSYFGPTDAPGNCWSVSAERELKTMRMHAVLDRLLLAGADEAAANREVRDAEASGAGNVVCFQGMHFYYAGNGVWTEGGSLA